jgi:hypothetical protein
MMDLGAIVKNIQKRIRKTGQKDLPDQIVSKSSSASMGQENLVFSHTLLQEDRKYLTRHGQVG